MKKTTIAATFVATILSVSAAQADHHGEPQYPWKGFFVIIKMVRD